MRGTWGQCPRWARGGKREGQKAEELYPVHRIKTRHSLPCIWCHVHLDLLTKGPRKNSQREKNEINISFIPSCTFFHTLTFLKLGRILEMMVHPNSIGSIFSFSVVCKVMVHRIIDGVFDLGNTVALAQFSVMNYRERSQKCGLE